MSRFALPIEMESFRDKLEKTVLPFVQLLPQALLEAETQPWQSKIGGNPYLPANAPYPLDADGAPMFLLTQINLEEMPVLPMFPRQGLLQFFLSTKCGESVSWEILPGDMRYVRVLYTSSFGKLPDWNPHFTQDFFKDFNLPLPAGTSYPVQFSLQNEIAPLCDYRFRQMFGEEFFAQFGHQQWDIMDLFLKMNDPSGHKIGGYSFFTQEDPRPQYPGDWIQLLQLDSDQKLGLYWGDMGVAHFFILKEDLLDRNFSKIYFQWDCY